MKDVIFGSGEDRAGNDGVRMAIGQTRGGRYLRVVYVHDADTNSIFVITAFELAGKPLAAYKRRRRKAR